MTLGVPAREAISARAGSGAAGRRVRCALARFARRPAPGWRERRARRTPA